MPERPMHAIPGAFQRLQYLYGEGEAAIADRDFARAYALFTEGLGIDDHFRHRYITMYTQRGRALMGLGRFAEAVADFTHALAMEPEFQFAELYFNRGFSHEKAGNADAAIADYDASTALFQDYAGPYHMRGRLHFHAGRYREAIDDFERVLELQHSDEATHLLAEARAKLPASAYAAVSGANAGDPDPVVFPGQRIARLSDYVRLIKSMQGGDVNGALVAFGLDMSTYPHVAQAWAMKMASDPALTAKFGQMMAGLA